MPNLTDLINQIPQVPQRQVAQPTQQDVTSRSMEQVLGFIARELPIKKDLANSQALHAKLASLVEKMEDLIERNDTPRFTKDVTDALGELVEKLESPIVNVDFPTEELVAIKRAVEAIKLESAASLSVSNLSEITKVLNDLKPYLLNIETAIQEKDSASKEVVVSNLGDIKVEGFPKEALKLLENLSLLDTDAKNPIAVRLSDGKKFYDILATVADNGTRAVAMGTTPSFIGTDGSPTRPYLDSNAILRTTPDAYTVKMTYASAGKPEYIGKAAPGSSVASALWQIQKLTYSGSDVTDVQWADGTNAFTKVWNSRTGYTYS